MPLIRHSRLSVRTLAIFASVPPCLVGTAQNRFQGGFQIVHAVAHRSASCSGCGRGGGRRRGCIPRPTQIVEAERLNLPDLALDIHHGVRDRDEVDGDQRHGRGEQRAFLPKEKVAARPAVSQSDEPAPPSPSASPGQESTGEHGLSDPYHRTGQRRELQSVSS